jgi:hypothetical protein
MRLRTRLMPQGYDQLVYRSRLAFHWRAEDLAVNPLTGQGATFARLSTTTGLDRHGTVFTVGWGHPAWAIVDGRTHMRLNYGAIREDWRAPMSLRPTHGMVGYLDLVDRDTAGDAVLHLGAGTTDTASVTVRQAAGGAWEVAVRHNGGLAVATATPTSTSGQRVRLYWVLTPTGSLQLQTRIGDGEWIAGDEVTGLSLPAAYAAPELRIGHITLGGSGKIDLRAVKLAIYRDGVE